MTIRRCWKVRTQCCRSSTYNKATQNQKGYGGNIIGLSIEKYLVEKALVANGVVLSGKRRRKTKITKEEKSAKLSKASLAAWEKRKSREDSAMAAKVAALRAKLGAHNIEFKQMMENINEI